MNLNLRALRLADAMAADAERLRIAPAMVGETRVIDCGVRAPGGLEAGRRLAEVCLAGLGDVSLTAAGRDWHDGPSVVVRTDAPVAACMASQYGGWEVTGEGFFAMGSGPMRAAAAREELFTHIPYREAADACVGVLECGESPPQAVCEDIAAKCGVAPNRLTLLYAPVDSQAGGLQVVVRSVETALHKLHELGFDLARVESAWGVAPLPPVAGDTLTGIGRTNDAILYGGHAVLWVRGDDASIESLGSQVPSNASRDYGRPFRDVFAAYDNDFYKIDKLLFSPAVVTFVNLDSGRTHRFGEYAPAVLAESFGLKGNRRQRR